MDFSNWPIWALLALLLLTNQHTLKFLDKVLSFFGIALTGGQKAESDERQWQRDREDRMFATFASLIESNRDENQKRIAELHNLTVELHKNTDALMRQIDMIRLLAYNAATVDEKLEVINDYMQKNS